jgi:hypothetical protein
MYTALLHTCVPGAEGGSVLLLDVSGCGGGRRIGCAVEADCACFEALCIASLRDKFGAVPL